MAVYSPTGSGFVPPHKDGPAVVGDGRQARRGISGRTEYHVAHSLSREFVDLALECGESGMIGQVVKGACARQFVVQSSHTGGGIPSQGPRVVGGKARSGRQEGSRDISGIQITCA